MRDTNEEYWSDYDGLQRAKHSILRYYLGAWFPILASWNGKVLYIDCHSGRGRHETGEEGSPIVALNCLLNHRNRDYILEKAEVDFMFFECDQDNAQALNHELTGLGRFPDKVNCKLICDDYQKQLSDRLELLEKTGGKLSPAFAFVDPYGYGISMELLNRLLSFRKCELFINLMYRYIDMAIHNPNKEKHMDCLFGTTLWNELKEINDPEKRISETIKLFSDQLSASYVTHIIMRGERNQVKYILIHAANHPKARDIMKEAIWKVIPDGGFTAYERDNPDQLVLLGPTPDLKPLKDFMWSKFGGKEVRMEDIYYAVGNTLYLPKHIHTVLKDYLDGGEITATGYEGRFAFNKNPLIQFPDDLMLF
jgi:three-Cys-motif partner protein